MPRLLPSLRLLLTLCLLAVAGRTVAADEPAEEKNAEPRNTIEVAGVLYPVYEIRKEAKPLQQFKVYSPRRAKKEGRGGTVLIGALIDRQGGVMQMQIAMSNAEADIEEAALKSVRKWIFPVQHVDGRAIAYAVMVPIVVDNTPHFGPQR
ncbi:energy transducer TonB [Synoicihabitans lomoniglobus]|uniref:Energy transducer TonB n=1 Tax=Synoicihabitans lomoniglobus TaxID=2909285 RepID=A0AAE9ZUD1_9BACT|nr:energy transducer TonB [Opitutaceae bacterium LMO-M01]WED64471.1 energy transducer TonB [Opitutaceae bacterium LMO-M01]